MLDPIVVEEFLDGEFEDSDVQIPSDVNKSDLVRAFCEYTENDYYEWLKDNFKSFFNHYHPDWDWIREKIREYK